MKTDRSSAASTGWAVTSGTSAATASAASSRPALPAPVANKVIGWNAAADALVNYSAADLATVVVAGTSYTDSGLTAATAYYYQVSALNAGGEGPASSVVTASTPPSTTPRTGLMSP